MTLFLLQQWKKQHGGPQNATAFLLALENDRAPVEEKACIVRALDEWEVLTPTWFEIADYLPTIERLHEDASFSERLRAALLASKVAYCLCDYAQALKFALSAEELFDLTPRQCSTEIGPQDEQYVNRMIEEALDTYKKLRRHDSAIDDRLEALVNRLFERNMERREFRYVVGLGLDTRRLDMIERAIKASDDQTALLAETVVKTLDTVVERGWRGQVLDLLLRMFAELEEPDFVSMCQCLIKLEKPGDVADILNRLTKTTDGELLAYQISFDLYENATQQFINKIDRALTGKDVDGLAVDEVMITDDGDEETTKAAEAVGKSADDGVAAEDKNGNTTAEQTKNAEAGSQKVVEQADAKTKSQHNNNDPTSRLRRILKGEETIKLHMQFLIKNNHTDMLILKQIKDSVRASTVHNGTVMANGLMHVGTTCDDFLRDNLDWIGKATNWNKFNAVASLGLIHRGHEANAMKVLDPYLPKGEADPFGYKEGGALYALGLIHANHGNPTVVGYLRDQLSRATSGPLRHGACLGLGLAAMGTHDEDVYLQLRETLYQDDAVSGEAAGLAMGLVMVGSLHQGAFDEMTQYVVDTQHDKIQRGLRTGIALLAYGQMEQAEGWIRTLLESKANPMLRQTGVWTMAMAYAGSGKADVVRRLLAKVATDPNQDVKRFAVTAVGFVLSNEPEQCLSYTGMLVEHFNGFVRYGAAMALGIACAGSGYKEAIALLEPLLTAKENYVRQGACIALSFVMIQQTEVTCPKVKEFRQTLTKMITEKGEEYITKFGAVVAQGILDAGGRNVTISMRSRSGHSDLGSVVGVLCFMQYWYWHSMTHFASLAFKPTCLIALNGNLDMPKMEFRSNAKPSMFAYPPPLEEKKKEEAEKVETVVLSITNKKKQTAAMAAGSTQRESTTSTQQEGGKEKKEGDEKMEVDVSVESGEEKSKEKDDGKDNKVKEGEDDGKKEAKDTEKTEKDKKEPEPNFQMLDNPARVVRLQLKCLALPETARYKPLKPLSHGGIIMMKDKRSGEHEQIVDAVQAGGMPGASTSAKETEPPSAF